MHWWLLTIVLDTVGSMLPRHTPASGTWARCAITPVQAGAAVLAEPGDAAHRNDDDVIWLVINMGESIALELEVDGTEAQNHCTGLLCLVCVSLVAAYMPYWTLVTRAETALY